MKPVRVRRQREGEERVLARVCVVVRGEARGLGKRQKQSRPVLGSMQGCQQNRSGRGGYLSCCFSWVIIRSHRAKRDGASPDLISFYVDCSQLFRAVSPGGVTCCSKCGSWECKSTCVQQYRYSFVNFTSMQCLGKGYPWPLVMPLASPKQDPWADYSIVMLNKNHLADRPDVSTFQD